MRRRFECRDRTILDIGRCRNISCFSFSRGCVYVFKCIKRVPRRKRLLCINATQQFQFFGIFRIVCPRPICGHFVAYRSLTFLCGKIKLPVIMCFVYNLCTCQVIVAAFICGLINGRNEIMCFRFILSHGCMNAFMRQNTVWI